MQKQSLPRRKGNPLYFKKRAIGNGVGIKGFVELKRTDCVIIIGQDGETKNNLTSPKF